MTTKNNDLFFAINSALTINVRPVELIPDKATFENEIPPIFRMAADLNQDMELIEQLSTGRFSNEIRQILRVLQSQTNRINMLLSFQFSQQDEIECRYQTERFGASFVTFISSTPWEAEQFVHLKLFLDNPMAAIYSYAKVSQSVQKDNHYLIQLDFVLLTEADEDLLVRATLQEQLRQLKQRREIQEEEQDNIN